MKQMRKAVEQSVNDPQYTAKHLDELEGISWAVDEAKRPLVGTGFLVWKANGKAREEAKAKAEAKAAKKAEADARKKEAARAAAERQRKAAADRRKGLEAAAAATAAAEERQSAGGGASAAAAPSPRRRQDKRKAIPADAVVIDCVDGPDSRRRGACRKGHRSPLDRWLEKRVKKE